MYRVVLDKGERERERKREGEGERERKGGDIHRVQEENMTSNPHKRHKSLNLFPHTPCPSHLCVLSVKVNDTSMLFGCPSLLLPVISPNTRSPGPHVSLPPPPPPPPPTNSLALPQKEGV